MDFYERENRKRERRNVHATANENGEFFNYALWRLDEREGREISALALSA